MVKFLQSTSISAAASRNQIEPDPVYLDMDNYDTYNQVSLRPGHNRYGNPIEQWQIMNNDNGTISIQERDKPGVLVCINPANGGYSFSKSVRNVTVKKDASQDEPACQFTLEPTQKQGEFKLKSKWNPGFPKAYIAYAECWKPKPSIGVTYRLRGWEENKIAQVLTGPKPSYCEKKIEFHDTFRFTNT